MKKAGILLAVLAAAILLKTQVWDRLTRPSAAENNLDRAYSITEIQSAADDLYSGFGLLPEDFDWEAACRESYYQAAETGSEYDYYLELCRLTAQLQDGHTTVIPPKGSDLLGNLPLALCHIEGEYYVRETLDAEELPLLSRLTKVNGSDVHAYFQGHVAPYVGVQTPDTREERWANFLCTQGERGSEVTLEFELPDGTEKELIYTYKELGLFDMGGHESQPVFQCGEEQLYDSDAFGLYRLEGGTPTEESILVVQVKTLTADPTAFREEYEQEILPRLSGVKGCILDFRTSGGGNSLNGMTVLAPFVPDETIRTAGGGSSLYQLQDSRLMTLAWFQSMDSDTLYRLGLDGQTLQNMRELYPDEVFDTGSQMLEGRYCVEESAFSALLELDEGDYPFQGLPKCSTPVTVLFSHFSGSAVDTTADYANAWGLTTIGAHTAGATGDLMVVPLCTGYAVTFSGSRQIASDGTDIQNNGVQPRIEVPVSLEAFRTGRDAYLERAAEELEKMASGALAE